VCVCGSRSGLVHRLIVYLVRCQTSKVWLASEACLMGLLSPWCWSFLSCAQELELCSGGGTHLKNTLQFMFQSTNALWPAFLAKIWQTMGTPAINAEASHSRWIPAPQGIFFWRVLARRRVTLREFSAGFSSFYTFPKWYFWRTHVWHKLSQLGERLGGPQKFPKKSSFHSQSFNTHQNEIPTPTHIKNK